MGWVPNGGHGGSDLGGDAGWMSGSMGSTPKKKRPITPLIWVALALLAFILYLLFG